MSGRWPGPCGGFRRVGHPGSCGCRFPSTAADHEAYNAVQPDGGQGHGHEAEGAAEHGDDSGEEEASLGDQVGHFRDRHRSDFSIERGHFGADCGDEDCGVAYGADHQRGMGSALLLVGEIEDRWRRVADRAVAGIFCHSYDLDGCVVAQANDVAQGFAQVAVAGQVTFGEGFVYHGYARRFSVVASGEFSAAENGDLQDREIVRIDLVVEEVEELFAVWSGVAVN